MDCSGTLIDTVLTLNCVQVSTWNVLDSSVVMGLCFVLIVLGFWLGTRYWISFVHK